MWLQLLTNPHPSAGTMAFNQEQQLLSIFLTVGETAESAWHVTALI